MMIVCQEESPEEKKLKKEKERLIKKQEKKDRSLKGLTAMEKVYPWTREIWVDTRSRHESFADYAKKHFMDLVKEYEEDEEDDVD